MAGLVLADIAGAIRWGRAWCCFFDRPNLAGRSIPGGPGAQGLRALSRMAKRWETASGGFHAAWLGAVIVKCFCFWIEAAVEKGG